MYRTSTPMPQPLAEPRLIDAGRQAKDLALDCTYNIESLAVMLIRLAEDQRTASSVMEAPSPAVLLMLGCRIKELNSVLMSYLGDDSISFIDAHRKIYRGAISLDREAGHG